MENGAFALLKYHVFENIMENRTFALLKYHVFENIMEKWSICSFGANALFSIFSKVFNLLDFSKLLKIENDVII